jgi:hypothetical protein
MRTLLFTSSLNAAENFNNKGISAARQACFDGTERGHLIITSFGDDLALIKILNVLFSPPFH